MQGISIYRATTGGATSGPVHVGPGALGPYVLPSQVKRALMSRLPKQRKSLSFISVGSTFPYPIITESRAVSTGLMEIGSSPWRCSLILQEPLALPAPVTDDIVANEHRSLSARNKSGLQNASSAL